MASTSLVPPEYDSTMGAILTTSNSNNHGIPSRLSRGVYWCLDNGVFTGKFSELAWKKKLDSLLPFKNSCLFIAIPDVVGNCDATLKQFSHYRKMVSDFPVALVSQDGISKVPEKIPWDDFDCVFVGGSDEHKLGKEAWWVIEQSKKHNKWVHIGRVNSISRMSKFYTADSWDGTHLGFFPSDVSKFHNAVLRIREKKTMKGFFDESYQKNSYDGDFSALYCVLTVSLNPISFGPLQFRAANLLMALMFFDIDFCFGLALGVFLGNLTSPFGLLDWGIMPFVTLVSALTAYRLRRFWYVGMAIWALATSAGVAYFPLGLGAQLPFVVTFPMVLVPQAIAGYVGYGLFRPFKKQFESRR